MMATGETDAKNLACLGVSCYGFFAMRLPEKKDFMRMIPRYHERIPIDALAFGMQVLHDVLADFCSRAKEL